MKDIIISVDSTSHKVNFPDEFLGIGYENLQGNLIFQFDNNFIGGQARLDISIDCESGMIPNLTPYENGYILPIKSSLLTGSNVLMQLVIDETSLTQYSLTTDTEINPNKTYYEKVGNDYIVVENPVIGDISQYYEANTPVFKTDIFSLKVKDSINAQETIPEQYPTWINTFNILVATLNQKLLLVDQALTEMGNLNISVSNKVNGEVTITFTDKEGNVKVVKINDGRGIVSIEKTGTSGNVDTYTITYTDNTTSTFQVTNGIDGTDGVGIESIYLTGTSGLTDTYTILYTNGATTEFQVKNGRGITKIEKISTNLLVDTYKITFNDGTTQNYEITNGKGIVSIEKTSTDGLTDIYTITYNDNTTTSFNVVNGKGIVSIEKTSTSGYVDTYTITYNDGTTSTYEVTNGEVSQAQLDALQDELNYYKTIVNALPKITGSGTSITLNNTADSILSNVLNPSELEQETTTGKNLWNSVLTYGRAWSNSDGTGNVWSNQYARSEDFIKVMPNTTYTISFISKDNAKTGNILSYTSSKTFIESIALYTHLTFTTSATTEYLKFNFFNANNYSSGDIYNIQLEVGSSATTYEPYTNGPAPNPSYPMPIHTISGSNKIIVENSNLFDYNTCSNTGISDDSGTISTLNTRLWSSKIKVVPSQKYTFKTTAKSSNNENIIINRIIYYDKNGDFLSRDYTYTSLSEATFTIPNNTYYIVLDLRTQALTTNLTKDILSGNTQLNKGETLLPYTPYVSQEANINLGNIEYCEIGDYKDEFVRSSGKNLFNESQLLEATDWTKNSSGYYNGTFSNFNSKWETNGFNINIDGTKQYTLSLDYYVTGGNAIIRFIYDDNTYSGISLTATSNTHITLTSTAGKIITKIMGTYGSGGSQTLYIKNMQLEIGSTATPYEPYGIGNWGIRKNIGKVVLDGTETGWARVDGNDDYRDFRILLNNSALSNTSPIGYICNKFISKNSNYWNEYSEHLVQMNDKRMSFRIAVSRMADSTLASWITWLSSNNLLVYYALETPTYTQITGTLAEELENIYQYLLSYKGQTNISQVNNDLPFIIDSTALKDLTSL